MVLRHITESIAQCTFHYVSNVLLRWLHDIAILCSSTIKYTLLATGKNLLANTSFLHDLCSIIIATWRIVIIPAKIANI